ncbi:hypothetical protein EVAR_51847_1 [Eumeta japonica]|uniref:Uncharacterized protein n=1 Tax=Eumeta variegata TaxID=151549 RepID=A0A4C1YS40_EUMVA|nr:hypothetical protein EVAR_51847_1 [Eumeta japonica]
MSYCLTKDDETEYTPLELRDRLTVVSLHGRYRDYHLGDNRRDVGSNVLRARPVGAAGHAARRNRAHVAPPARAPSAPTNYITRYRHYLSIVRNSNEGYVFTFNSGKQAPRRHAARRPPPPSRRTAAAPSRASKAESVHRDSTSATNRGTRRRVADTCRRLRHSLEPVD